MTLSFQVTGMFCASCSAAVEKAVRALDGVDRVNVNLLANKMTVDFDENSCSAEAVIHAVTQAGYGAELYSFEKEQERHKAKIRAEISKMKKRLIASILLLIPLMYVSMGSMVGLPLPAFIENSVLIFALTQFVFTLPIIIINFHYFTNGFKALFRGKPNMNSLIAIGSLAALVYGIYALIMIASATAQHNTEILHRFHHELYFEAAAMILTLVTLGKYLETRAKGKTNSALEKLMALSPETASIEENGEIREVPVSDVKKGDIVLVKSGQRIPVDGIITEGAAAVDQSAITGESIPAELSIGDKVTSATISKSGFIKFKATNVGEDTTLAQIIRLVDEAGSSKAPIAKLADKISGIFVPIVIGIAVLTAAVWLLAGQGAEFALSMGISVLVISCPCALGLATPVAIMVGTGVGAQQGVLIKSAETLESAYKINAVVLDKTGTITQGKPAVTEIQPIACTQQELMRIAYALELKSEHPLAKSIIEKAESFKTEAPETRDFLSVAGKGISAVIDGQTYYGGNLRFLEENHIDISAYKDESKNATPIFFSNQKELIGVIYAADTIKPEAKEAIIQLEEMKIDTVMLTGDNEHTAKFVAEETGVKKYIAQVLPQDKEKHVAELQAQGKHVAMVGDGINDAPALARADVGIAIGAGTDIAMESADIVLTRNKLTDVVTAIRLSRETIQNIKMNLFWALFYNSIGIPLAAGVFFPLLGWKLNPMFAAAAMSLSSVCVVLNALRLRRFHKNKEYKKIGRHKK